MTSVAVSTSDSRPIDDLIIMRRPRKFPHRRRCLRHPQHVENARTMPSGAATRAAQARRLTRADVARRSSPAEAWVIVDDRVYDVTKFADLHPGGARLLHEYAGKDATAVFFQLHRREVLDKFGAQMLVGTLDGASPELPPPPLVSSVPFAENAWLRDAHSSPYYTESHRRFHTAVRELLRSIQPEADRAETAGAAPTPEMFRRLGTAGYLACRIGPAVMPLMPHISLPGGVAPAEFDYFHEMIAHEEMGMLGCPAYADGLGGGMVIGLPPVLVFGEPSLAQRVASDVLSGSRQIALAISEPFAGSDVANIKATAVRSADGSHFVVNGVKKWITNGTFAHYFATAVRTGGEGIGGISLLLIERSEGLSTDQIKVMYGSAAGTALVTLDNVRVPASNLLGEENGGFRCIMFNFNHERCACGRERTRPALRAPGRRLLRVRSAPRAETLYRARNLATPRAAGLINAGVLRGTRAVLEECFKWAHQRETFGSKLTDKPVIREKLARMAMQVDAAHAWLESITFQMTRMSYEEQARQLAGPIALHKLLVTRTATLVADEAMQIFGGRSLTQTGMGRYVERFWRTVKFGAILGGSEEIMADLGIKQALRNWPPQARL